MKDEKLEKLKEAGLITDYNYESFNDINSFGERVYQESLSITFPNDVRLTINSKNRLDIW